MAKATFSQPSVRSKTTPSGRPGGPRASVLVLSTIGLAMLGGFALTQSRPGAALIHGVHWFLEYYAGVFTLVSLSITVMTGLAATDRIVLMARHRVLLQAVHRAMAVVSMTFLAVHIAMKVLEGHASVIDVIVPFLAAHQVVYVGLGTIASYFMITVTWTGIIRGRFAGSAHPGLWRALHASAYLSWPVALVHGLKSGRPAATWVTVSYVVCVLLVVVALLVRVCVSWGQRLRGPKAQTTGTIKAVGRPVSNHPRPERLVLPEPMPERLPRSQPTRNRLPPPEPITVAPSRRESPVMVGGRQYEDADPYGADSNSADPYAADPYGADPYGAAASSGAGSYGAGRQPASRARLAVERRLADSERRPGGAVDARVARHATAEQPLVEPRMPRHSAIDGPTGPAPARPRPGRSSWEAVTPPEVITHSGVLPPLSYLDGSPPPQQHTYRPIEDGPAFPESAYPDAYESRPSGRVGRHSGEYPTVAPASNGHRKAIRAEPEDEPHPGYYPGYTQPAYTQPAYTESAYNDPGYADSGYDDPGYDEPGYTDSGYPEGGYADAGYAETDYPETDYPEPEAPSARSRVAADDLVTGVPEDPPARRRRSLAELTETPNDLPATRKPAAEITDEEFWAHMRGEALR